AAVSPGLYRLAMGGTAVGPRLNASPGFGADAAKMIAELTGRPFVTAPNRSVMMVTALSPVTGYDRASEIAHLAIDHDLTLKQAALQRGVSEDLYDRVVVPEKLTRPGTADAAASR